MKPGWIVLVVALAAFFAHVRARSGEFVYFDDGRYVVRNEHIETIGNPLRFFTDLDTLTAPDSPTRDIYRPVRTLSYAVIYQISGKDSPAPYHTLAVLLHAACAGLLALLLLDSGLGRWPAAAGAILFAVHPVTVETTAWVCSLGDVWAGLFVVASMLAWARDRRLLAFVALVLALFSKEHAVVLPGLWLAWDWALRPERFDAERRTRTLLAGAGAGLAVVALFLVFRGALLGARMSQIDEGYGIWTSLAGLWTYAWGILFPVGSTFGLRIPTEEGPLAWPVFGGLLVLVALGYGVARGSPRVRLGATWFLMALVPVSNVFITLKIPTADRFLYIPLMGLAFIAGELVKRTMPWSARLAPVVVILLSISAVTRIGDWKNSQALIEAGLRVQPKSKSLIWAEAGLTAQVAVDRVLAGDGAGAEALADRAVGLYEKYLRNTVPAEQTSVLVELGDLFYAVGQGRARYAPGQHTAAFSRSLEAYVAARKLQMKGIGRTNEEETRHTAIRIVELSVTLADLRNKDLPQTIAVGLESLQFLEQNYGVELPLKKAQLRFIDSVRARGREPEKAREGFRRVLETLNELERDGVKGLSYLRAQAVYYKSTLKDMDPDIRGLEEAYKFYTAAMHESRAFYLQALFFKARVACLIGKLKQDQAWIDEGHNLLKSIPEQARKHGLKITPTLAAQIQGLQGGCGR